MTPASPCQIYENSFLRALVFDQVDNHRQPNFFGCRPTDLERFAKRRDVCRVVIQLPSAIQNWSLRLMFFFDSDYVANCTPLLMCF